MSLTDLPPRITSRLLVGPGCWKWLGSHFPSGYGVVWHNGKTRRIHIVTYEAEFGPVPDGLQLDHVKERCADGPPCPNPWHVEPVTGRENNLRGDGPAAVNFRKTHCIRGHEFTPENTITLKTPGSYGIGRACRVCARVGDKTYYNRERATEKARRQRAQRYAREGRVDVGKNANKTHCKYGHEFSVDNTYLTKKGTRCCRACQSEYQRKLREGRK